MAVCTAMATTHAGQDEQFTASSARATWAAGPRTYVVADASEDLIKRAYRLELLNAMPPDYFDVEAILDIQ